MTKVMVQTVATAPEGGKTAGAGAAAAAAAGAHPVVTAALQLMGVARVLEVTVVQAPGLTVAQAPRAVVTTTMLMLPPVVPQQEASHLEV
jgi:hypothetical protein